MANVAAATNAVHLNWIGEQVHYLRALGPFSPESLATFSNRIDDQPQQRLQRSPLSYKNLASRPAQLRHAPVRLRGDRDARPRNAERTRPSYGRVEGGTAKNRKRSARSSTKG